MWIFQRIGFTLNGEDHYDLEGSLTDNAKIEEFDETPWHDICVTDCYHGEKEALLGFLDREFPGRWEYEAGTALQHGKAPEEIIMLWTPDRSELIGYCMLTVEKMPDSNQMVVADLDRSALLKNPGTSCGRLYTASVTLSASETWRRDR